MSKQKPTLAQHYVPQFYLKYFSLDGKRIFQFDVCTGIQTPAPVSIRSICFKNNPYEFQDNEGRIINRNLIEKSLSVYEVIFAQTIRSIIEKTHNTSLLFSNEFLSTQEQAFLIVFISTLILRHPIILNAGIETAKDSFGSNITHYQAKNLTLQMCLPLYKEINPKEKTIFNAILSWFENLSFQICVSNKDVFTTSNHPVQIIGKYTPEYPRIDELFLPLTPRIMLRMIPEEKTPENFKNRMIPLSEKMVDIINREYFAHCKKWVYSNSPLTEKQIKMIEKGRRRK